MDVKTTFLHGDLEQTIYMKQHEGFVEDKAKVCLLKKIFAWVETNPKTVVSSV